MSPRSRRRTPSAPNTAPRVPAQRGPRDPRPRPQIFVPNDDALLVLHRAAEDPGFQGFVDGLPLVGMVGDFLEWVGDGVALPSDDDVQDDDAQDDDAAPSFVDLDQRLGVEVIGSSGVGRWRARVLCMACAHWGLVVLTEDGVAPGHDVDGWDTDDAVERTWVRSLVAAAALECTARYVAAQHLEGDQVRHALATVVASAGEQTVWPLGLMSALRPGDLLSEHVDRVVLEHVTELRAWGVLAGGHDIRAAPGAEPLLASVALGLRADPVPMPSS